MLAAEYVSQVHLVDSFAGLPTATQAKDKNAWSKMAYVSISLAEVRSHFTAYGLHDKQQVRTINAALAVL